MGMATPARRTADMHMRPLPPFAPNLTLLVAARRGEDGGMISVFYPRSPRGRLLLLEHVDEVQRSKWGSSSGCARTSPRGTQLMDPLMRLEVLVLVRRA